MRSHASILILATVALASCSEEPTAAAVAAPPQPTAAASPSPAAAVFDFDEADLVQRLSVDLPISTDLAPAGEGGDCRASMGDQMALTICSEGGKVAGFVMVSRRSSQPQLLDAAVRAAAGAVAADASQADIERVVGEARKARAAGQLTAVCPTTRCFMAGTVGERWSVAVKADGV